MIGRVYKITSCKGDEIYIGSTTQILTQRFGEHKYEYTSKRRPGKKSSSWVLFDKYGVENCKIELIKEYEIVDRQHLDAYEQLWINKTKCINYKNTIKFTRLWDRKKKKEYTKKHKERITKYQEEYRKTHREKNIEYQKEYRKRNSQN